MKFHVITNVWGERHTDLFLKMTLPNVLSSGNLPALASAHNVRYRIYTTPSDRAHIEASEPGRRLAQLMPLDFVTPLGDRVPDVFYHVHWFHRAAAEAKCDGAIAVFVAPDSLWSDGTFRHCGEIMARGYKAIATPFLQVVVETCLPDALKRFGGQPDGSISIPPAGLYELGRRHLHPLTALAMPRSPHGRPALDLIWPVPGEGFVSRFAVRELFAFDPRRCPITFLWYAGGPEDQESIYLASGPEEMAMLSVDPLDKHHVNYIVGHAVTPGDLVRSTLHPWNVKDQNQTRVFARRRMYWHGASKSPAKWRRAEARSDLAMREVEVRRIAQRLWTVLCEIGCARAAGILALALEATPLARRWREDIPLTVFVPSDEALAAPKGHRFGQRNANTRAMPTLQLRRIVHRVLSLVRRIAQHALALLRGTARRVVTLLRNKGYENVVELVKRALKAMGFRRRVRADAPQPLTVPTAEAPACVERHWLDSLLAVGAEPALMRLLRRHVIAGEVGRTIGRFVAADGSPTEITGGASGLQVDGCNIVSGPYDINGVTIWVVDGVLVTPVALRLAD